MIIAPWYIRNRDLRKNRAIPSVTQEIKFVAKHEAILHYHTNPEVLQQLDNQNFFRRLKRVKPFELVMFSICAIGQKAEHSASF